MRIRIISLAMLVLISFSAISQEVSKVGKEFSISVNPPDATIYYYTGYAVQNNQLVSDALKHPDMESTGKYKKLGKGKAGINIRDYNDRIVVVAQKEGYLPEVRVYEFDKEIRKEMLTLGIPMTTRVFYLDAQPFGAEIFLDGEKMSKPYPALVTIPVNSSRSVEVKKPGYATVNEVFYNQDQKPQPPIGVKTLVLENRLTQLQVFPATGSYIKIDGVQKGEGSADVIIPIGECAVVKIKKEGYTEIERQYCNKAGSTEPPLNDKIMLEDREVLVRAPEGSSIYVNGKISGTKETAVKILKESQADVSIQKPGYVTYRKVFYNKSEEVAPPVFVNIEEKSADFPEDESYTASSESNLANINFTLNIPTTMTEENAWKIIATIVQSYFDELEQIDKETGYMRTAWVYKTFNNVRTVRTRIIVKINSRTPLKYSIKISSEENSNAQALQSKDDYFYRPWNRVLNQYKELITEAQSRLQ